MYIHNNKSFQLLNLGPPVSYYLVTINRICRYLYGHVPFFLFVLASPICYFHLADYKLISQHGGVKIPKTLHTRKSVPCLIRDRNSQLVAIFTYGKSNFSLLSCDLVLGNRMKKFSYHFNYYSHRILINKIKKRKLSSYQIIYMFSFANSILED